MMDARAMTSQPTAEPPARDMALDSGRHVSHGLRGLLSRGATHARGHGRRVLDGRAPGHRGRVPSVREGDGPRHARRAAPRSGRLPRRRPGAPRAGRARLPSDPRARQPRRLPQLVVVRPRCELAPPRGARAATRTVAIGTRSRTSRGRTSRRTPPGPGRICRPRPSGSSPPGAAWRARSSPGATSSSPAAG